MKEFAELSQKSDAMLVDIQRRMSSANFSILEITRMMDKLKVINFKRSRLLYGMMGRKSSSAGLVIFNVLEIISHSIIPCSV